MLLEIMAIQYSVQVWDFAEWCVFDYVPEHGAAYVLEIEQLISPDSVNGESAKQSRLRWLAPSLMLTLIGQGVYFLWGGEVCNSQSFISCCRPQHCVRNM